MGHIFVSYSRHDLEMVDGMVGKFESAGIKVWIDREDIKAGKTWRVQIVEAIDTCDAFVLMLSAHSAVSDNVRKEIDLAQDSGRTVFIMRLDSVGKLPAEMRYQLVGLQYIDLQQLGIEAAVTQLIDTLKDQRAPSKSDEAQTVRQAEIVIQGVDPSTFGAEKQEQLIDFVAELTQTPDSELQITNLTAGSVHVFVDMPATTAFELKTRALNRDRHFKPLGIHSLRLVGDRKYINISLGVLTTTATLGAMKLLWMSIPAWLPSIVGVTTGKVIVLTSAIVATTALGITLSHKMNPTLDLIAVPSTIAMPTDFSPITQTPTPQKPLVIRDTLCWNGPGQGYAEMSSVLAGTTVELLGRGSLTRWFIVLNPRYQVPCWMRISDLQLDPNYDIASLPIFTPPAMLSSGKENSAGSDVTITPTRWRFPACFYNGTCIFPIPTTPIPPPS